MDSPTLAPESTSEYASLKGLFEAQSEGSLVGLKAIQASLAECVQGNNEILERSATIERRFGEIAEKARAIDGSSSQLASELDASREQVDTMSERAREIANALEGIHSISQQTNLLALNAAVEAARAGAAGAGFAVVATEVKTLSAQTEEIVSSVSDLLQRLSDSSHSVQQAIDRANAHGRSTSSNLADLNAAMQQTTDDNRRSVANIAGNNERVFVNLAKLDHVIWKVNTYLSVLRNERMFEYVDYHNCRLGKWYYEGDGRQHFAGTPSFGDLEQPHALVHEGTREAFEQMEEGADLAALEAALELMEKGSRGVFAVLDRILAERRA